MTIRQRLVAAFLVLLIFVVLTGLAGRRGMVGIGRTFSVLAEQTLPTVKALEDVRFAGLRIVSSTSEFGFVRAEQTAAGARDASAEAREAELIQEGLNAYHAATARLGLLVESDTGAIQHPYREILALGDELAALSAEIITLKQRGVAGVRILELKETFEEHEQRFLENINEALQIEATRLLRQQDEVRAATAAATRNVLAAALVGLILSLAAAAYLSRSIVRPILRMRDAARAIEAGTVGKQIPVTGRDEIGDLADSFNRMSRELLRILTDLSHQRQFLRQIIDANPDMIFVKDANGVYTLANRAAADFYGTGADDVVGKREGDFAFAPEHLARSVDEDRDVLASQQPKVMPETPVTHPRTGEKRWFHTVKVPLLASDGGRQVLGVATDITHRRQLEEQLRQAQKMEAVGQLTGGIAHDLNNILTAVRANADLIAGALPDAPDEVRNEVAEVQAAAARGSSMIRKLMAFSRRGILKLQPLDLNRLITELAPTVGRLIPTSIDIQVFPGGDLPTIQADSGAVEQVLVNLVTNARDAMPQGGVLRIETRRAWLDQESRATKGWGDPGEYACCTISDTGVGMDAVTQARVFEPFFTTKPVGSGTGLGMAMVYGLMKQHRGFVDLYSELGLGTTVKLYFPMTTDSVVERVAPTPGAAPPRGTETILVVEDEAPIRRATERVLRRLGYEVLLAPDGEEALAIFAAHEREIALVVTDMVMPKLGGRELYERLRGEGKQVPFLFSSGYTARDVQESTHLDPTLPFLHKPWTLTDMAHRVRDVLDTHGPSDHAVRPAADPS